MLLHTQVAEVVTARDDALSRVSTLQQAANSHAAQVSIFRALSAACLPACLPT